MALGGSNATGGVAGVQSDPRQAADGGFDVGDALDAMDSAKSTAKEEALVKKQWKEYDKGRKFDEAFRKQIAIDRRYAAGTSDLTWAVTTNLIGAFIDILVALLYARNPDVSVTKAAQVDDENTQQMDDFARTLQIVISHLWRKGNLKKAARKAVRSVLSNAEGWFKCTMVSEKDPQPQVETALNDAKETLELLRAQQAMLADPQGKDQDQIDAEIAEKEALTQELHDKIELAVNKMFVIDYVKTENMQISTDVESIEDYLNANWCANEIFMDKEEVLAKFPRLTEEDITSADKFYQRAPKELVPNEGDGILPQAVITAEAAQTFTQSNSVEESIAFYKVVEQWSRGDKLIRTMVKGVKKWAIEPYHPPYPTSRFYPYFYVAFYEVDGSRHAQSLAWRLYKLQDEYSATRSNFRITRERCIPGVLFNGTMLDSTQAQKLSGSKHQEYTALFPANPETPLQSLFAQKPVNGIDPRLFDPAMILSDMERISGVQEALSAAINGPGNPKTATEANIQQSGTAARTTSNRDALESALTEMAQYTAEQAIQCLEIPDAQRIAGQGAFWPHGMSIEDLFTLVEVDIEAGTTGRPRQQTDVQAWSTLLPLLKQTIVEIEQALGSGNLPMAKALTELIKETMIRMGDESDPDRFIPKTPPPGSPGAGATPPPPPPPNVSISLRGELSPADAAALVQPNLIADQKADAPPPSPTPPQGPQGPVPPQAPTAPTPPPHAGP